MAEFSSKTKRMSGKMIMVRPLKGFVFLFLECAGSLTELGWPIFSGGSLDGGGSKGTGGGGSLSQLFWAVSFITSL